MGSLLNSFYSFLKRNKKQITFNLFLNLVFIVCITCSSYVHIPLSGFEDRVLYIMHLALLQFSISGYIYLFTVNKWVFKYIFLPVFFVFSMFSYWVYSQDISVTNSLVQAVFESKPSIFVDLITVQYLIFFLTIVFVIFFINRFYNKAGGFKINIPAIILVIFSIGSFVLVENRRFNTLKSRLPYSLVYGVKDYLNKDEISFRNVADEAYSAIDSINIVLVLGETVRADHLHINGYYRNTTPLLSKRGDVISYKNVYTPHTYTATSLPRIVSDKSIYDEEMIEMTSVFDVYNKCNFNTVWYGNQELERSYRSIVKTNKKVVLIDSLRSVLSLKKALDNQLLTPFKEGLNKNKKNGLHTLHMMGSHWWYEKRYTDKFRVFKPVINSKHVPSQSKDQMVNSYDNTILFLDNFLNEVINILEEIKHSTVVIYISDHGEALGEQNLWLHAQNSKSSMNPAMLLWFSSEFKERFPNKVKMAQENKNKVLSTDIIYHSLLDLLEVKGVDYQGSKSVFSRLLKEEELKDITEH